MDRSLREGAFEGETHIVTGAGSGIGHAIARGLAAHGAQVVLVDVDAGKLADAANAMAAEGARRPITAAIDVTNEDAVQKTVQKALEETGRVNGVVNAAGIARRVQNQLGQAFLRLGWYTEAEETMRGAIAGHPSESDELGMQLRYGLMTVLQQKAEQDRDLAAAEEAFKIASKIAINQIDYEDIRERRAALQELVKKLKDAA